MTSAAGKYRENIGFFSSLLTARTAAKLNFDPATGLFSSGSNALARTFGNWRAAAGAEQSVTNDAMFHNPVVEVFSQAAGQNMDAPSRINAYKGLATLRKQYAGDRTKAAALQKTLLDILPFVPFELMNETRNRFRTIQPADVMGPLELSFLDKVWEFRAELFSLLDQAQQPADLANPDNRTHASVSQRIYKLYNANREARIPNYMEWTRRLPALTRGSDGEYYYYLQHSNQYVHRKQPHLLALKGYNTDFIYYNPARGIEGQTLWRIYLNFMPQYAGPLLTHLWSVADRYAIASFKIAGPAAFHTRTDKVVVYVSRSGLDGLAADLRGRDFGFKDPVPAMTFWISRGISKGVEPGPLNIGFSYYGKLDPDDLQRQSYGTIRSDLIAAALTQMHAVTFRDGREQERYRADKTTFLKWVAIAFESYRRQLDGFEQ